MINSIITCRIQYGVRKYSMICVQYNCDLPMIMNVDVRQLLVHLNVIGALQNCLSTFYRPKGWI